MIPLGAAKGPMDLRTWRTRSFFTWSFVSTPSFRATKALTAWPESSSWTPTTAASATWSVVCYYCYDLVPDLCVRGYLRCSRSAASISAVDSR